MDTISLKEYIFNNNKIEFILDKIGCHNIKYHKNKNYYSAAQPDGDNLQGVNISNNKYLSYRSFSRGIQYDENKDLISLVQDIKHYSFIDVIKYLHSILELEYKWYQKIVKPKENKDPLQIFKKVRSKRRIDVSELNVLNENILNDYISILHIDWFREGVMPWSAKKFGLAYSYRRHRVIIPMRYWLTGELLGINSRTTIKNYDELGIKKFLITPTYKKSLNLFGLWENRKSIEKAGYVVIAESEKSVLKRDSLYDSTVVALSGHIISDEQVRILIGLNVEIVIAMDKDICIDEIRFMCEKFYRIRKISYIYDNYNILNEKDAPMDAKNKDYQFLFDNRVSYNSKEHREYLNSLKK